jgi:hypothetical protein
MDDSFCAGVCISASTLESPGFQIEEGCQKHFDHDDIWMHILCRWVVWIKSGRESLCASRTPTPPANKVGETYVHGSVGSVLGAFAISLLGSAYSRLCNGYAFAAMVPGVLLLVPTGLIAVGGLAQNYSSNDDQFASGLNTGLAMIQSMCIAIPGHAVF